MMEKYGRTFGCPSCGGRFGIRRSTERRERVEKLLMNGAMEATGHGVSVLGHEVPPAADQPQVVAGLEVHAGEVEPTAMDIMIPPAPDGNDDPHDATIVEEKSHDPDMLE